jgi:hypothetical protein
MKPSLIAINARDGELTKGILAICGVKPAHGVLTVNAPKFFRVSKIEKKERTKNKKYDERITDVEKRMAL